jgi:predicted nucleic acid-binding protein
MKMPQIVFLDTNVILDYLENRNQEVGYIIKRLLDFHKEGKIILATSVFNVAELIDKEFEINFFGTLLFNKLSFDEILKRKSNKPLFREISREHKKQIEKNVKNFLDDNSIEILSFTKKYEEVNQEFENNEELYNLIYEHQFTSQDALIIIAALSNKVTYFLSNDGDIVKQLNDKGLMDSYNLRNNAQREYFQDNVLDGLAEVLK